MPSFAPEGLPIVWDERFSEYSFGPDHPFQAGYRGLAVLLFEAAAQAHARAYEPIRTIEPAPEADLLRFHRPAYLAKVRAASEPDERVWLDRGDTPGFPGCYGASARVVAGALAAWRAARDRPGHRSFHPAGGLHHAAPGAASGFCVFNDVAVLLKAALDGPDRIDRAVYVDIDAHHGDGVMYGFLSDGRLLDIDFHQDGRTLFPGTGFPSETGTGDGAGKKVNVPLFPGSGDAEFVALFDRLVPSLIEEHRPQLIVLQHGMDGHRGDPLAQLELGRRSYDRALTYLSGWAEDHRVPIVVTGGGGYSPENVALGLATAGLRLVRPAFDPTPEDRLPDDFRAAFAARTGSSAPTHWERPMPDPGPVPPSVGTILQALSESLGRRF